MTPQEWNEYVEKEAERKLPILLDTKTHIRQVDYARLGFKKGI